jgi:hypothetical protein
VVGSRDTLGTAKARSCGQLALKTDPTVCIAIRIQTGVGAVPNRRPFAGVLSLPFRPTGDTRLVRGAAAEPDWILQRPGWTNPPKIRACRRLT